MHPLSFVEFVFEDIAAASFSSSSYTSPLGAHTWAEIPENAQAECPWEISEGGQKEEVWAQQ